MKKNGCKAKKCSPGGRKSAITRAMSPKTSGAGFPTLADLKKTVPPGGLLNPGLRKGFSVTNPR